MDDLKNLSTMNGISPNFAKSFAEEWISSWNSHDINKVLSHYSEDFLIDSQMVFKLVPGSNGTVVGKKAVKEYWISGLKQNKDLEFKLLDILTGINGLTIYYLNMATNLRAVEMLLFNNEGKVQRAFVHHSQ